MNAIVWRLVWKEYRLQRAFWLAVLGIIVLGQLLGLLIEHDGDRAAYLFTFGPVLTALFAAGIGATLFAAERETGTFDFQRVLPAVPWAVYAAKVAVAVAAIVAMLAAARVSAWGVAVFGQFVFDAVFERSWSEAMIWGVWGVGAIEGLAWGTFFSLLGRRTLVTAVLAIFAASAGAHTLAELSGVTPPWSQEAYLAAVPFRLALAALVVAATLPLAGRWFRDRQTTSAAPLWWGEATARPDARRLTADHPPPRLRRLLWQHWRQLRGMALLYGLLAVAATALWGLQMRMAIEWRLQGYYVIHPGLPYLLAIMGVFGTLVGAAVFLADQRGNSRLFLAERGLSGGIVWLSRQVVGLGFTAAVALGLLPVVLMAAAGSSWPRQTPENVVGPQAAVLVTLLTVSSYAVGQFASMVIRSGLIAAVVSLFLTALVCAWAALAYFLSLGWWWSVLPLSAVLLAATYLRAGDWMVGRRGAARWARVLSPVVVYLLGLVVAVPLVRIAQIPAVDAGNTLAEATRVPSAEAQETARLYEVAGNHLRPFRDRDPSGEAIGAGWDPWEGLAPRSGPLVDAEQQWLEKNPVALELALEAAMRHEFRHFDPRYPEDASLRLRRQFSRLAALVTVSGRQLETEGDLAGALDRYVAAMRIANHAGGASDADRYGRVALAGWAAAAAREEPELLHTAIERLGEVRAARPSLVEPYLDQYVVRAQAIAGDEESVAAMLGHTHVYGFQLWHRLMPWERVRHRRIVDTLFRPYFLAAQSNEARLAQGHRIEEEMDPWPWEYADSAQEAFPQERLIGPWGDTLAPSLRDHWLRGGIALDSHPRALQVCLALAAYQADHGNVPDSLDALLGTYLDEFPPDPYTGRPFLYFPEGRHSAAAWLVAEPEEWHGYGGLSAYQLSPRVQVANIPHDWSSDRVARIEEGPFLWSPAGRVQFAEEELDDFVEQGPQNLRLWGFVERHRSWSSFLPHQRTVFPIHRPQDVYTWGHVFPVPLPLEAQGP